MHASAYLPRYMHFRSYAQLYANARKLVLHRQKSHIKPYAYRLLHMEDLIAYNLTGGFMRTIIICKCK